MKISSSIYACANAATQKRTKKSQGGVGVGECQATDAFKAAASPLSAKAVSGGAVSVPETHVDW